MGITDTTKLPDPDLETMRCVINGEGAILFASPALAWALGVDAKALPGQKFENFCKLVEPDAQVKSGFHEVALLRKDRDPVVMEARIDAVQTPDGKTSTVVWVDPGKKGKRKFAGSYARFARDLAETAVQKSEMPIIAAPKAAEIGHADSELRHFLNLSNDLLGVYTTSWTFVRVNPAFNRVLGYSDHELKTFPFLDLICPEDKELAERKMEKIRNAPPEVEIRADFSCRAIAKGGGVRWIEWILKSIGSYVYIVGRDVTDIKQHACELEHREQQLSEAQKIGKMGHWYWVVGQDVIEWSDQIYTVFGVERGRFSPTLDNINSLLLKRDIGRIYGAFNDALKTRRDYTLEFRIHHPQGGIRFIRCEGRCNIDKKTNEVSALFGIMQDITERTLHERALKEAKEAAESSYASKTRFLANMSHELRTPLNAIIGFSEMMQRQLLGPLGNARYLDYIGGIHESGEHLLDLINDILDMSKIEVGKYELLAEELNIGKLIRLAAHMMEGRAHESQVQLISDDIPDDVQIIADRRALMQILLNLLSNAVKFTKPGGTVEIKCHKDLGGVAIIVSDTGIGIPKDKLPVITLPFEQVDSELTRQHEGSGLGLAITKDLIELHGGRLEIESEQGIGTTVAVILPEKAAAIAPAPEPAIRRFERPDETPQARKG